MNDIELFKELIKLNKNYSDDIRDEDNTRFHEIYDYFVYKTLAYIKEEIDDESFIEELQKFSDEAEKIEKDSKSIWSLSEFFNTLSQILILNVDEDNAKEWLKKFEI